MRLKYYWQNVLAASNILLISSLFALGAMANPAAAETNKEAGSKISSYKTTSHSFISKSAGHQTDGRVKIVWEKDRQYLEFDERFATFRGPNLKVILHREHLVPTKIEESNYISLASLKSFRGKQKYLIGDRIDLTQYASVAIWCEKYNITFAHATLPKTASIISSGEFLALSSHYPTQGKVSIIEERGENYLQFAPAFSVTKTQDLEVILHRYNSVSSNIKDREYIKLGSLKKINGKQRYLLPKEIDVKDYVAVVIWNDRLNLTVGYADL